MQKLVKLNNPFDSDVEKFNTTYLDKGWNIIKMLTYDSKVILLIEKVNRKEKLEKLNEL